MEQELKKIKKYYGEEMAHFCRRFFPTLLEEKWLLFNTLQKHFAASFQLYLDIIDNNAQNQFIRFIHGKAKSIKFETLKTLKTPKELLESANYDFYECKSESEIQSFKKYYAKGEELCTFRYHKLHDHYVFFAVKKNVSLIKRSEVPSRQDEYGTSVISIQFTKTKPSFLSIKNRYNHTVINPDATFSNNLENIVPGLTYAFEKYYGFSIKTFDSEFELPNYTVGADGKYYKYNYEINGIFYCVNNTILDGDKVITLDPEKYLLFDYFILDLQNEKKMILYDKKRDDSFAHYSIHNVFLKKEGNKKVINLYFKNNPVPAILTLDSENRMQEMVFNSFSHIEDGFCEWVNYVEKLDIDAVESIGSKFFKQNDSIQEIKCSHLKIIGDSCLEANKSLVEFYANQVERIGRDFLMFNSILKKLEIKNVRSIGSSSFLLNHSLDEVSFEYLEEIGQKVLACNCSISKISCNYKIVGGLDFLRDNKNKEVRRLKRKIYFYQLQQALLEKKEEFLLRKKV